MNAATLAPADVAVVLDAAERALHAPRVSAALDAQHRATLAGWRRNASGHWVKAQPRFEPMSNHEMTLVRERAGSGV